MARGSKSKRLPLAKKHKIERKIREHKRKVKKESKKKSHPNKSKKDPGIPNLYPFKERVLKQIQSRKRQLEEEKQRQKEQRHKEKMKRRSLKGIQSLEGLQAQAQKRAEDFEEKEAMKDDVAESKQNSEGRSTRAYYKEFHKVVEASDVVLEVLDARDPLGCRCFEVEEAVLASGSRKKLILVLNKIDLVPRENVVKWLKYLREEFPAVAFKASTQSQKHHLSQKKFPLGSAPGALGQSSVCLGVDVLTKLLGNYCRNAGIKATIVVGVVGIPNVGKSSILNSLKRSKVCGVGATPGITKSMQEVVLDKHIKLLDSPGIILKKEKDYDPSMALRNCVKVESLMDVMSPVAAILCRCNREQIMLRYCVPEFSDTESFLSHLAQKLGRLKKGGVPDVDAAAKTVLHDWNSGKIKYYTHPPETHTLPMHVSAEIVQEWGAAFNMSAVQEVEAKDFEGLAERLEGALIIDSSGPADIMEA